MEKLNEIKSEVLNFADDFVSKLPYFNPREVILECTNCETPLYETIRETLQLEQLKPKDFNPIIPQKEEAKHSVTCWKCKTSMSPYINYLNEGHKRI